MAFQFGFSNEDDDDGADVDVDGADGDKNCTTGADNAADGDRTHELNRPVRAHTVQELISYSIIRVESPTGKVLYVPRRDLHDVKVQLLREGEGNDVIIDQIDKSDISSGIYEGGLKTWECSLDLASLLLDRGPRKDIDELVRCDQVIELGAGTAIPSLVLFQHAWLNELPLTFTLADYNDTVLRTVTLPNILLMWAMLSPAYDFPPNDEGEGDFEITASLLEPFMHDLSERNIHLNFLSGPWSTQLSSLIPSSAPDMGTLVLGAETIYSPASTAAFVEILVELLKRVKMSKAMIGAKRIYFGVGGSVDGLKEACRDRGAVAYEIENHGVPGMESGVGRALIEVQMF